MQRKRRPIVLVRKVQNEFEYYIQQGNHKINFFLNRETHEELKQAQAFAEILPRNEEHPSRPAIPLRVAESA